MNGVVLLAGVQRTVIHDGEMGTCLINTYKAGGFKWVIDDVKYNVLSRPFGFAEPNR